MLKQSLYIPLGLVLLVYPLSTLHLAKLYSILIIVSFFMMICVECSRRNKTLFSVISHTKYFLLIHLWFLVSALIGGFDPHEMSGIILPVLFVIFTHYSFQSFQNYKIKNFGRLLFFAYLAVLIADIYLLIRFGSLRADNREEKEIIGSFANVNVGVMIMAVVYSFLFYKHTRSIRYLIVIAISALIITMTMSRAGLLLLCGAFFYGIYLLSSYGRQIIFLKLISYVTVTVFTGALVITLVPGVQEKITITMERFDSAKNLTSILSGEVDQELGDVKRQSQYAAAVEVIMNKPLTGIGYGTFPDYIEAHYGVRVHVHNMFLKTWVAVGFGGVILMFFLFFQLFIRLIKRRKYLLRRGNIKLAEIYSATIIMLMFFIVQGQFRGMFGDLSFLFFLGFAYTLAWAPMNCGSWIKKTTSRLSENYPETVVLTDSKLYLISRP